MRSQLVVLLLFVTLGTISANAAPVDRIRFETLEKVTWQDGKSFSGKIIQGRMPTLLVEGKAHSLAWLPSITTLSASFRSVAAKQESSRIVARRLDSTGMFHIGCCKPLSVTLADFWTELKAASKEGKYFSTMISQSSLEEEHPLRRMFPSNPNFVPSRDATETSIWMGSQGSHYPLQFSVSDQFIAQAHGSSEVFIFSPEHTSHLRPFGKSHPRYREARLNLFASDSEDTAETVLLSTDTSADTLPETEVAGYRVVLNAGDTLFIPARWFVHIKADSPISAWFISQYESRFASKYALAYNENIPREPWWEEHDSLVADKLFVRMSIDQFNLLHDPSLSSATGKDRFLLVDRFIEKILLPRFGPNGAAGGQITFSGDISCPDDPQLKLHEALQEGSNTEERPVPEQFWTESHNFAEICGTEQIEQFITQENRAEAFERTSRRVAMHFQSRGSSLMLDSVYFADFIEDLLSQSMGSKHVETFIRECLLSPAPTHRSRDAQ